MTDQTRSWKRRACGILAAATVAAGVLAAGAAPAHALIRPDASGCWDPVEIYCIEGTGPDYGGGGGGGGFQSGHGGMVGADVDQLVLDRLADFDCSQLIAGGLNVTGAASPENVYRNATVVRSPTPDPEGGLAKAPVGAGSGGTITVYPQYDTEPPEAIFGYLPPHTGLDRLPSPTEMKAMTVLHEDAHLMGTLGSHTQEQSNQFNLQILTRCLGINKIN
jgi:hypothetical protein